MSESMAGKASADLPDAVHRLCGQGESTYLLPHHAEAARRLTRLLHRARLRQRVTMSYDPGRIDGRSANAQADMTDDAADARARLTRLASSLADECWGVMVDVCLYDKGLQLLEQERGWPRRSAKLVLRIALDQLAMTWGLRPEARGPDKARQRTWLPQRPPMFAEMPD
jgi:hypothetical protein